MKKLTLSVAVLLGSISAKAQTEYVELKSNKLFKRSYASYYNDSPTAMEDDLSVSVVKGKLDYHWVEYTNVAKVVLICADPKNTYRKICVNSDCNIYNTYNQVYNFNLTGVDSLKFFKPNYNE